MNYELAKELKDAGFPQTGESRFIDELAYTPTLEELIEECPKTRDFPELELENLSFDLCFSKRADGWLAGYEHYDYFAGDILGEGSTPTEAVARLWLALQHSERANMANLDSQ